MSFIVTPNINHTIILSAIQHLYIICLRCPWALFTQIFLSFFMIRIQSTINTSQVSPSLRQIHLAFWTLLAFSSFPTWPLISPHTITYSLFYAVRIVPSWIKNSFCSIINCPPVEHKLKLDLILTCPTHIMRTANWMTVIGWKHARGFLYAGKWQENMERMVDLNSWCDMLSFTAIKLRLE